MIFKEWYGAYYNTIAKILDIAVKRPVSKEEIRKIINDQAFSESILAIEPSLSEGKWQLLKKDGTTPIRHVPTIPLTDVQKHWLKAISLDPRIKLFDIEVPDVEPLFTPDDIYIFDQYTDGDPYESEDYRRNFRIILDAIHNGQPLEITLQTRSGKHQQIYATPERLEYSEKDNKF